MRRSLTVALGAGALLGVAAAFNDWVRWNVGPVPRSVPGEPHFYQWREGAVYYEAAGPQTAPPLLLVHGIHAAASSYEMRSIFTALAAHYRVYLPDLLGYGRSERPALNYTSDTYVDLWSDFVRDVAAPDGRPVHVLASSLSAAHIIAAAARHPERFSRLLLICPAGIDTLANPPGVAARFLHAILRTPVWGTALFNLLVTRVSLAAFLRRQAYADPRGVTPAVLAEYYTTSHQPGAKWAPTAFVTGYLNRAIAADLVALRNPVHLAWGKRASVSPPAQAEAFRIVHRSATLKLFDRSALLPYVEQPEEFVEWALAALGAAAAV